MKEVFPFLLLLLRFMIDGFLKAYSGELGGNDRDIALESAFRSLVHIFAGCKEHEAEPDVLQSILTMASTFSEEEIEQLVDLYSQFEEEEEVEGGSFQATGRLKGLRWETAVSVASSKCGSLHVPIVRLQFVTEENGEGKKVTEMEMSLQEFRVCVLYFLFRSFFDRVFCVFPFFS